MANTTNLNLEKIAGSDKLNTFPTPYNSNMDKIDTFGGSTVAKEKALGSGIAILCDGDVHDYIAAGAYVYVMNNTHGLADGLYYNSSGSGRATNSDIRPESYTAVSDGGINALNSKIAPFFNAKSWSDGTKPTLTNGTHYGTGCYYFKIGCLVYVSISVEFSSAPTNVALFSLPSGYKPIGSAEICVSGGGSYNAKAQCQIDPSNGIVKVTSVDKWVIGSGFFLVGG